MTNPYRSPSSSNADLTPKHELRWVRAAAAVGALLIVTGLVLAGVGYVVAFFNVSNESGQPKPAGLANDIAFATLLARIGIPVLLSGLAMLLVAAVLTAIPALRRLAGRRE